MPSLRQALALLVLVVPTTALAQTPTPPEGTPPAEGAPPPEGTPEAPPAETPAPAPKPEVTVGAKYDKGFVLETSDDMFHLKIGLRTQTRVESVNAGDTEFKTRFMLPRIRLQLEGYAFGKANTYKFEFDAANKGFALLKDFYVDHAFGKVHLRAGQWKRPFSRQEMVSDFGSEFLERSIANEFGGGGRDIGVAVHNDYEKSPEGLEWALGLFNGASEKPIPVTPVCTDPADAETCTVGTPTNVPGDFGPMLVVRVGFNKGKIKGYSEADLEGGPLRLAVGVSYKVNFRDLEEDAAGDLQLQHAVEVDAMVKVNGIDVTGAFYLVKNGSADAETGFYGQAGAFITPKKHQLAARFAMVPAGDENRIEALGAFTWFFAGHNFKWATDGGILKTTGVDGQDIQIRSQIQFVF